MGEQALTDHDADRHAEEIAARATRSCPTPSTLPWSTSSSPTSTGSTKGYGRARRQRVRGPAGPFGSTTCSTTASSGSRCRCTPTCSRWSSGCSTGAASSRRCRRSTSAPTRTPNRSRRPAHPHPEAASADGVQHHVGAHRLHRRQRRHPAGARQPPRRGEPEFGQGLQHRGRRDAQGVGARVAQPVARRRRQPRGSSSHRHELLHGPSASRRTSSSACRPSWCAASRSASSSSSGTPCTAA